MSGCFSSATTLSSVWSPNGTSLAPYPTVLTPERTPASEIAHRTLLWCDADTPVAEAADEMMEQWVRHLLIEANGVLIGIISIRDLLGFYASQESLD